MLAIAGLRCGSGPARQAGNPAAGDAAFRERDAALRIDVDALIARCTPAPRTDPECPRSACELRPRERQLFADVQAHAFTDITESNYWHRGRLKFPSELEQWLRRLAEESPRMALPCERIDAAGRQPPQR